MFDGADRSTLVLINTAGERSARWVSASSPASWTRPERSPCRPPSWPGEHLGRPVPNAALLGAFAALSGLVSVESRRRPRSASGSPAAVGRGQRRRRPRRLRPAAAPPAGHPPERREADGHAIEQIEGSRAVAAAVARLPARGHLRLPDLPADPHRRGARAELVKSGDAGAAASSSTSSPSSRAMSAGHRGLGGRRPGLHRDREPGPAVHGRGAVQRLRAGSADRDDGGQPGHRRPDQHLERPQRLDEPARLRLDPALRGGQPGGGRPARAGLPAGRGGVAAGDGVHGRVRAHARLSSGVDAARPRRRSTRSCRRTSRARCSTRPSRSRSARWSGPRRSPRCATWRTPGRCGAGR